MWADGMCSFCAMPNPCAIQTTSQHPCFCNSLPTGLGLLPGLVWALFSGSGTPSEGMTVRVHTQGLRNSYLVWLEFKCPDMSTRAIVSSSPLVWDLAVLG